RIISTGFMTGTGLKKWSPRNRSARFVADAISVIERELVLLANTVSAGQIPSSSANRRLLSSLLSMLASKTVSPAPTSRRAPAPPPRRGSLRDHGADKRRSRRDPGPDPGGRPHPTDALVRARRVARVNDRDRLSPFDPVADLPPDDQSGPGIDPVLDPLAPGP